MKLYLNDDLRCSGLMQAKRSEMVYLLNCYYPIKELAAFTPRFTGIATVSSIS